VTARGSDETLQAVLEEARERGFLGPVEVREHLRHAGAFAAAAEALLEGPPTDLVDLGSGAGVPGLALALRWEGTATVLVEVGSRRCAALRGAVARLGLSERCRVVEGRAEDLARGAELRARGALVVARAFGPPPVVAEVGGAFVAPGGYLLVSEPPDARARLGTRWPGAALRRLGLGGPQLLVHDGRHFVAIRRSGPVPGETPRRTGIPAKRPLW